MSCLPYILHTVYTHTHTHLTAFCLGLPGWASTRKVKPIWILLKQETVSGNGISWAICKSAQPRQHPTTRFFTGRKPFLPPNQQCTSTEGYIQYIVQSYTASVTGIHWTVSGCTQKLQFNFSFEILCFDITSWVLRRHPTWKVSSATPHPKRFIVKPRNRACVKHRKF